MNKIFQAILIVNIDGKIDKKNIGWFPDLETMLKEIERNAEFLTECRWSHICIEESQPDIWLCGRVVKWLEYCDHTCNWLDTHEPEWAKSLFNWGG
jgi:hypothetical protein